MPDQTHLSLLGPVAADRSGEPLQEWCPGVACPSSWLSSASGACAQHQASLIGCHRPAVFYEVWPSTGGWCAVQHFCAPAWRHQRAVLVQWPSPCGPWRSGAAGWKAPMAGAAGGAGGCGGCRGCRVRIHGLIFGGSRDSRRRKTRQQQVPSHQEAALNCWAAAAHVDGVATLCTHLSVAWPIAVACDMVEWCEWAEKAGCPLRPPRTAAPGSALTLCSRCSSCAMWCRLASADAPVAGRPGCAGRASAVAAAEPACNCSCWRLRQTSVGRPPFAARACRNSEQSR
jgi:hypothetical protein